VLIDHRARAPGAARCLSVPARVSATSSAMQAGSRSGAARRPAHLQSSGGVDETDSTIRCPCGCSGSWVPR